MSAANSIELLKILFMPCSSHFCQWEEHDDYIFASDFFLFLVANLLKYVSRNENTYFKNFLLTGLYVHSKIKKYRENENCTVNGVNFIISIFL